MMARIRIEKKVRRPLREDRSPILPVDPRDPDVMRVKRGGGDPRPLRDRF
jgi:hypothetical protein